MAPDEVAEYRNARRWVIGLVAGLMVLGGIATVTGRAFDLFWYPWEIKQRTGMIRASNSYVTTQQAALRQFRASYEDADTDGQRTAIARQMHDIADLIPGDVQPDIAAWLGSH